MHINTPCWFYLFSNVQKNPPGSRFSIGDSYEKKINQSFLKKLNKDKAKNKNFSRSSHQSFLSSDVPPFVPKFEVPNREKTIEIFIDKQGYSTYLSTYYEMKFKRNRFLIMNEKLYPIEIKKVGQFTVFFGASSTRKENLQLPFSSLSFSSVQNDHLVDKVMIRSNIFENFQFKEITNIGPSAPSTVSNLKDCCPRFYLKKICIAQIMRSTFGRIEFYLHTLNFPDEKI